MITKCVVGLSSLNYRKLAEVCHYFQAERNFEGLETEEKQISLKITLPFNISKTIIKRILWSCILREDVEEGVLEENLKNVIKVLDLWGADEMFKKIVQSKVLDQTNLTKVCQFVKAVYFSLNDHPWTDLTLKSLQERTGFEISGQELAKLSYYEFKNLVKKQERCSQYAKKNEVFECDFCNGEVVYLKDAPVKDQYRYVLSSCCATKIHMKPECQSAFLKRGQCKFCDTALMQSGQIEEHYTLHL